MPIGTSNINQSFVMISEAYYGDAEKKRFVARASIL